jgi:putative transposase
VLDSREETMRESSEMARKKKEPGIPSELLDELLKDYEKPDDLLGKDGILDQLKKAVMERALGSELSEHLGYEVGDPSGSGSGNSRNGYGKKRVITDSSQVEIEVPRDRAGTFEPQLIRKRQTRLAGFDEKVISMYARGMTVREIKGHLEELYGIGVSPDLISRVTAEVVEEVKAWQSRPLEQLYMVVFFDALRVKIRDEGVVRNKAVYLALGVRTDGTKEILGLWIEQNEGAKFWLLVVNELKNRGVGDILIAVVDGLKGFPEAINAAFPKTRVQTCIVHLLRHSLKFVGFKERREVATALKAIYKAPSVKAAEEGLSDFESAWNDRYPAIGRSWRRNWEQVIPFFDFPPEIRRVIYTTNAIESLHSSIRKVIRNRGHFPNDEAATKLIYLALRNIEKKWIMPSRTWKEALNQFAVLYEDRLNAGS